MPDDPHAAPDDAAPVLVREAGAAGRLTLNRPDALHALNQEMCEIMLSALLGWRGDPGTAFVLVDHAEGTRGFCAGGDIRMLASSGAGDSAEARRFFRTEYTLNAAIHRFPKPYIALMDGVTMGGGVGISVHGRFPVSTERTLFAMPETGIGLFPDVGGAWFLPRLSGETGLWLALTGARLKGADVAASGVSRFHVPSERLETLKAVLEELGPEANAEGIEEVLSAHAEAPGAPSFAPHQALIDRAFAAPDAEGIVAALEADGSDWGRQQADAIRTKSPETVKLALRQLREGRRMERFEDVMRMEYRIGWRKVASPDFLEGVRAVIVDKDNAPRWAPASLEDVPEASLDRYFAPLGEDELDLS